MADTKLISKTPFFKQAIGGSLTIIALCFFTLFNQQKSRLNIIEDRVRSVEQQYQGHPNRHIGKYRYILLENYPIPVEIFIGKDAGDFKPKLEQIDDLKPGDIIKVHYATSTEAGSNEMIRTTELIEREGKPVFIAGSATKIILYTCIGLGLAIGITVLVLKQQRRIL